MDVWMLELFQGVRFIRFKICGHIDTDERAQKRGFLAPFISYVSMLDIEPVCPCDVT